ncbi:hypothetical protein OUZ56_018547 [Daphnia magna]|uniref:Uncharacterized protein n=1 Tax=Daphnia magna TaxID=35525 RepID=A0ABQ9Z953_9CRUS|nr:hypothetical protein OUZ56_018547 [Daphnia magna]
MGLFVTGCDCLTTGANRPLSIPAASSSITLVTFTGIICQKLACRTHSSEVAEHNRGIFMTPAAGSPCGRALEHYGYVVFTSVTPIPSSNVEHVKTGPFLTV